MLQIRGILAPVLVADVLSNEFLIVVQTHPRVAKYKLQILTNQGIWHRIMVVVVAQENVSVALHLGISVLMVPPISE